MSEQKKYWINDFGKPVVETCHLFEDGTVKSVANAVNGKEITEAEYDKLRTEWFSAQQAEYEAALNRGQELQAQADQEALALEVDAQSVHDEAINSGMSPLMAVALARNIYVDFAV